MMKIGFIGAGKMAQALAKGFIAAGLSKPEYIIASCPPQDKHLLDDFKNMGCDTTFQNKGVAAESDVIILATKHHVVPSILADVNPAIMDRHLFISIAMGVPVKTLEECLPAKTRVVRVMPNTPALVRSGASVFVRGSAIIEGDDEMTRKLFSAVGTCEEAPESLLDAVTALSGAGPAYMFMVIEALADGGVKMGIPRDLSQRLAAQTMLGAAKMVMDTKRHPEALKDDVCSPAGCTIEGVHHLEKRGFRAALIDAVEAATIKCKAT